MTEYKEKFTLLKPWLGQMLSEIKKELKNDHLKKDPQFSKKYFNKPYHRVENSELSVGYCAAVDAGEDHIGEFIFQRWILKHSDIYHFFAQALEKINPDFAAIEQIDTEVATEIAEKSKVQFGAKNSYIFTVINSVAFPKSVIDDLQKQATDETETAQKMRKELQTIESQEALIKGYETKIQRLTDRYEKKLAGLQLKYKVDTDKLKNQVANLQRKL